jgi:uncharacterized protein (TIGR03086 family)
MNRSGSATVTLPTDLEILITRVFDSSPEKVFRAWTEPQFVRRWWGREDAPLVICDIDLRPGGDWRYVSRTAEGVELGWHGTYLEVEAPHRLVSTEVFEGYPDAQSQNTLTLTPGEGDKTVLEVRVLHTSKANRDGHVDSGMEHGLQQSLNAVDEVLATMPSVLAERYRNVAARFTERVRGVPAERWDDPAPCEGWAARDIVRHLVEWVPALIRDAGIEGFPPIPSDDPDPLPAWLALDAAVQAILDDPVASAQTFSHPMAGTHRLDEALSMFLLGDVLVHTWDLARATGQDEALDADEVAGMYEGILPMDEMLRQSGQYGPRVAVSDDADTQTKLLAFVGRTP